MADKIKYIVDRCRWQLTDGAHFSQKLFGFNFFDFPNFLIITSGNAVSSCSNNRGRCHTFLLILGCRVKDSRTDHWQIHFSLQSALPHSLPMVFKVKKWFKAQNIECNFNLWLPCLFNFNDWQIHCSFCSALPCSIIYFWVHKIDCTWAESGQSAEDKMQF